MLLQGKKTVYKAVTNAGFSIISDKTTKSEYFYPDFINISPL